MSTTNPQESSIEVRTIILESIKFDRGFSFDVGEGRDAQASLGVHLETPMEGAMHRSTRCNIELRDPSDDAIVQIQTIFRTEFDVQGNAEAEGIDAYLSSLAMRVSYPYHRQLIASLTTQSGLSGMTIPLISDDQLGAIAKEAKATTESTESQA